MIRPRRLKNRTVWIADIWIDGKRKRPRFPTRQAAQSWLDNTRIALRKGEYIPPETAWTFEDAARVFFAARQDRRPRTITNLKGHLEQHLIPALGPERLDRITVTRVEDLRAALQKRLKHSSTAIILRTLSATFKFAIHHGRCTVNPVAKIEREHGASAEVGYYEEPREGTAIARAAVPMHAEVRALIAKLPAGCIRTFVATAAGTGAREGELCALLWTNVELGAPGQPGKITITRSLSWARGAEDVIRPKFYPPKSASGIRTIPIPSQLCDMLRDWQEQSGDLVFDNPDGLPMYTSTVLRAIRATGSRIKLHSLRHYYASSLIEAGATVTEVQRLLGHRDASITLRTYLHFFERGEPSKALETAAARLFDGQRLDTQADDAGRTASQNVSKES